VKNSIEYMPVEKTAIEAIMIKAKKQVVVVFL